MPISYIGIGSNLGNREENISNALSLMKKAGIDVLRTATIIETEPVGYLDQDKFLNTVIKVKTALDPHGLLKRLKKIEKKLKRVRIIKNGPRTIDCDILLYDNAEVNTCDLILPHPKMHERDFVLIPLKEIAPDIIINTHAHR